MDTRLDGMKEFAGCDECLNSNRLELTRESAEYRRRRLERYCIHVPTSQAERTLAGNAHRILRTIRREAIRPDECCAKIHLDRPSIAAIRIHTRARNSS